jgi:hypothetical protein
MDTLYLNHFAVKLSDMPKTQKAFGVQDLLKTTPLVTFLKSKDLLVELMPLNSKSRQER